MAEFCRDCYIRMGMPLLEHEKLVESADHDLCEGCGQWKPIVEHIRPKTVGERWREIRTVKPKCQKPKRKPK